MEKASSLVREHARDAAQPPPTPPSSNPKRGSSSSNLVIAVLGVELGFLRRLNCSLASRRTTVALIYRQKELKSAKDAFDDTIWAQQRSISQKILG